MKTNLTILALLFFTACTTVEKKEEKVAPVQVILTTSKGDITLQLSNKTPKHRDNFIKLVSEGAYDSILFHRVLQDFVVQAGERDSTYVWGDDSTRYSYKVPAEFDTTLFHKRGAIGAARDGNPERASSSIQFYIVHRGPKPDSLIDRDEKRINEWLAKHYTLNAPENEALKDSILKATEDQNREMYTMYNDSIQSMAKTFEFDEYLIPDDHREIYRTIGGTPHLDQNYTVFGEVIEGMNIVDSLAAVKVNEQGRPLEKLFILEARLVSDSN